MKKVFVYFCRFVSSPFLEKFFIEKVEGKENIPLRGPFIIAPNHINGRDHWFLASLFKDQLEDIRFVGALDDLKTFVMSGLLYFFSEPVLFNRKRVDRVGILDKLTNEVRKNKIVVIYPEGGTNNKKVLLKGKTGIADLAIRTQVPIIPVGMNKGNVRFKRIIRVGKPIVCIKEKEIADRIKDNEKEYNSLLRKVTDRVMLELSDLCQKPYRYEI